MRKAKAILSWSLDMVCGNCEKEIDLADGPYDDDGTFSLPIFNNRWDEINGEIVTCEKCGEEIIIKDVKY